MTSLNSVPDEPFNLFDKEELLYSAAEVAHGEINAKEELTTIQLRRPKPESEWFQLHPGTDYIWPVSIYERVGEKGDEPYLVPGRFRRLFADRALKPVRLRLAVNSLGTPFIWPLKVDTSHDNRMANHYYALQRVEEDAEKTWVKLSAYDFSNRAYGHSTAPDDIGDPRWPEGKTMSDLLEIGFNGKVIDCADHAVILEYQGRKT